MLTKEEEDFIDYWEKNRDKEKSVMHQLKAGLLPGIVFIIAIVAIVFSGWYARAEMVMNNSGSIVAIFFALIIIVVAFAIFYKRQQWDQKEQYYKELKVKKNKS